MIKAIGKKGDDSKVDKFADRVEIVDDLETDRQYIFVQESGVIAIWKVRNNHGRDEDLKNAIKYLAWWYRNRLGRSFDIMQKKLLSI